MFKKQYKNRDIRRNYHHDRGLRDWERIDDGYFKQSYKDKFESDYIKESIARARKYDNMQKIKEFNDKIAND